MPEELERREKRMKGVDQEMKSKKSLVQRKTPNSEGGGRLKETEHNVAREPGEGERDRESVSCTTRPVASHTDKTTW